MRRLEDELADIIGKAKHILQPIMPSSHMFWDLGIDSLSFIQILVDIEDTLGITFELCEMERCKTVGGLMELSREKIAGKGITI